MNFPGPLIKAIKDYTSLVGKGYPDKRTLELVADRYQLDRAGRAVLFRGVFKKDVNAIRRSKLLHKLPQQGSVVKVDALNQLYTIGSYLGGQLVFIASDGLLRDASGFHGAAFPEKILEQATKNLFTLLQSLPGLRVEFLVDAQADSYIGVSQALKEYTDILNIIESESVDALLYGRGEFIPATSDSAIIDRTDNPVIDLARIVLEENFKVKIPDIAEILSQNT